MSQFKPSLHSLETARRVALLREEREVADKAQCDELQRWLDEQDELDAKAKLWGLAVAEKGDDGE